MHRLFGSLVLLAIAGFGQTKPAAKPVPPPAKKSVTGHSASSDVALEKDIRARFARSKISTDKFEVKVQGGIATITGKTDVLQHKGVATRLARNAGAAQVVNKVEVSDAAKQQASQNLASGGRRAQVKRSDVAGRK
jgi:hypothetical protein